MVLKQILSPEVPRHFPRKAAFYSVNGHKIDASFFLNKYIGEDHFWEIPRINCFYVSTDGGGIAKAAVSEGTCP